MQFPKALQFWRRQDSGEMASRFPTQQLFILALVRICEPIAFMSIFPYIYYMIESFGITTDSTQIAVYAGMVTSSFAFAEFSTSIIWGWLSDRIGRKPVLLCGLVGTAVSMIIFGFSTSLPMALVARALGGLLNGNIGVINTVVAELVTVKAHQPRAYALMPFVWCLGSILGPAMGGALAQPAKSFPNMFADDSIFARYPFLLSNLICVVVLCCGFVIGILFLRETHAEHKDKLDLGVALGDKILSVITRKTRSDLVEKVANQEEKVALLLDETSNYGTEEPDSRRSSITITADEIVQDEAPKKWLSSTSVLLERRVMMNILGYGLLAYHAISFDQMMPIFLSSPVIHEPATSPLHFTGGFGFSSQTVGLMLTAQGVYSMFIQIYLFPYVIKKFGALRTFQATVCVWPLLYLLVPYLVFLPPQLQTAGILGALGWRITAQCFSFPTMQILLSNSAPSMLVLGLISSAAGSSASLARAIGPTLSGNLFSYGLSIGYVGLAWWITGIVAVLGAVQSLLMTEGKGRLDEPVIKTTQEVAEG